MKKFVHLLSSSVIAVGMASGVALADSSITNTGPGSFNWILNKETNKVTITCDNNVDVVSINNQSANSGTAEVESNTSGGNATSGDAKNVNQVVVDMSIGCAPVQQASTPPSSGGQGGGGQTSTPVQSTPVSTLPSTGSNAAVMVAGIATASAVAIAAVSRFGATAYRKLF